jgi:hypothetical protein
MWIFPKVLSIIGVCTTWFIWQVVFFISSYEALPVCPTYALPQSGHVNLYIPEAEYLSTCIGFSFRCDCMVLLVLYEIFRFVFLKIWVIVRVSFPTYVKLTHFLLSFLFCRICVVVVIWIFLFLYVFHCLWMVFVVAHDADYGIVFFGYGFFVQVVCV